MGLLEERKENPRRNDPDIDKVVQSNAVNFATKECPT